MQAMRLTYPDKIRAVCEVQFQPTRAHEGDAGLDLRSTISTVIYPHEMLVVGTGLKVEVPLGWVAIATPRSSQGKIKVGLANTIGVIDHQYRGEILLMIENNGKDEYLIKQGDRIGQLIIIPCWIGNLTFVDQLSDSKRGANGFGSTGTK